MYLCDTLLQITVLMKGAGPKDRDRGAIRRFGRFVDGNDAQHVPKRRRRDEAADWQGVDGREEERDAVMPLCCGAAHINTDALFQMERVRFFGTFHTTRSPELLLL